jgi:hypothetical protein
MLIGGIFSYLRLSPEKFASAMSAYWRLNNGRTSAGCARLRNLKSQACSITPDSDVHDDVGPHRALPIKCCR